MASSKKWASIISSIASLLYFIVIIFQIPLFRVPCRIGICSTPIEVTSSQLMAAEIIPAVLVKALLHPGAVAQAIIKNTTTPSYGNLLNVYNFTNVKQNPTSFDLKRIEILAGSYFSVIGAILGVLKRGRMSLFGTLLIIWGVVKEVISRKSAKGHHAPETLYIYPTMLITLVSAFLSVKSDVRKIIRSCKRRRVVKIPPMYLKKKHK